MERAAGYARPKKFPREIGKIGSTLALQDICRKFRMPFETAVPFNDVSKFDARQFIDSDSIIVRTEDRRKEFVIADKKPISEITAEVRQFIGKEGAERFIVQSVGLRSGIEKHGVIHLEITERGQFIFSIGSKPYKHPRGESDIFAVYHEFEWIFDKPELGKEAQKERYNILGMAKAPTLAGYIFSRMTPSQSLMIRFVKYHGEEQAKFFDMMVH